MRRVTLTAQTLVGSLAGKDLTWEPRREVWGALREAHGEDSGQDEFLRLASSETPENGYRLRPLSVRQSLALRHCIHRISRSPKPKVQSPWRR